MRSTSLQEGWNTEMFNHFSWSGVCQRFFFLSVVRLRGQNIFLVLLKVPVYDFSAVCELQALVLKGQLGLGSLARSPLVELNYCLL